MYIYYETKEHKEINGQIFYIWPVFAWLSVTMSPCHFICLSQIYIVYHCACLSDQVWPLHAGHKGGGGLQLLTLSVLVTEGVNNSRLTLSVLVTEEVNNSRLILNMLTSERINNSMLSHSVLAIERELTFCVILQQVGHRERVNNSRLPLNMLTT